MKKYILTIAAVLSFGFVAGAEESAANIRIYGFIRNYAHMDSRECTAGTADLFNYIPVYYKEDEDPGFNPTYHFTAITSRLGVDVSGYKYGNATFGAKIESDFYNGLSGVTGTAVFRLRQAFVTVNLQSENGSVSAFKIGQAWHPMAADMPDIFSLNTGAPFGPFSRTPLAQYDQKFSSSKLSLTAAAIWQQQYTHNGPEGSSANYQKYSPIPEFYAGVNFIGGPFLARLGGDITNIRPYQGGEFLTEMAAFFYAQYKKGLFSAKVKSVFAQDGSQYNLSGGYVVKQTASDVKDITFTPTLNSSTWFSLCYGKKTQAILFGGFVRNFGTVEEPASVKGDGYYYGKNTDKHLNTLWRLTPTVIRNWGKFALGLEYEITSAQYGDIFNPVNGLFDSNLHWMTNHRVQMMVKYTF